MPTKTLRTKIVSQTTASLMVASWSYGRRLGCRRSAGRGSGSALDRLAGRLVPDRAVVGDAGAGHDLVVEVGREGAAVAVVAGRGHQGDDVDDVLGVEPRGRPGHLRRHVARRPRPGRCRSAPPRRRTEPSTLPPVSAARSTTTEPGLHLLDHRAGHQHRRLPARDGGGGDQRVGGGDVRRQQLALPGRAVLGHLAGVAAGALERLELEVDRLGAHRPDLLGGGGADVVRLDDGAEPLGGGDRLQPGDAGAEHDDLGRLDGAGGGHVQREEAAQQPGGDDRAAVAGDQRLRRQRVHRLGPRDARHQLHRERP